MPKLKTRVTRDYIENLSDDALAPLDVAQAVLPLSASTFQRMAKSGVLTPVRIGGRRLYRMGRIRELVRGATVA
jgi:hypothetical protein